MAAVSLIPSPGIPSKMTSRRQPLQPIPNATNSPYRGLAQAGKRGRSFASDQRESTYGQPPPAKKQMIEVDDAESRRNTLLRKTGSAQPTALQRKLEAVRDAKPKTKAIEPSQKANEDNLETIRQWKRHYRKVFPQYVFYFDQLPEEARLKASRQVQHLGAVCLLYCNTVHDTH